MAARKRYALSMSLVRTRIARVHIKRMTFEGPLHARPVGSRDDREITLRLRSTTGCKNRPKAETPAGARSAGWRVDIQEIQRVTISRVDESALTRDGLRHRHV